jgi:phosphonopyruvate decarboxylase
LISPQSFLLSLQKHDIAFYAGVPDSLLKEFLSELSKKTSAETHFICANEGNAVALAAGYHLSTGKLPLVYMQNSGLGNSVNPLMSLCHKQVYSIPMLLLIGWRGEPGEFDEPQHVAMGSITPQLLDQMQITYFILDKNAQPDELITKASREALSQSAPVALLCRKEAFDKAEKAPTQESQLKLTRRVAIETVLLAAKESVTICNTGFTAREVFGQRAFSGASHLEDFLNAGAMGHASQIALGMASGKPSQQFICFDGDGAILMHLGGLALIGPRAPSNLTHILLNNGVHDSVGAQPTAGFEIDLKQIASACGYPKVDSCETVEQLEKLIDEHLSCGTLSFLEIKICPGSSDKLPRPPQDFARQKLQFMENLLSK